jgi:hypothetical protein
MSRAPVGTRSLLGATGIFGAPAFLVQWLAFGAPAPDAPQDAVATLVHVVYLAGFASSALALRLLRATGGGRGAAVIAAAQGVGLLLAAAQVLQDAVRARPLGDGFYAATDVAWPLSHLFMLVVGVAVLRARVWTGWRRWTPLACGLALPAAFAAMAVGGRAAMIAAFATATAAAFLALGVAVLGAPAARAR